MPYNFDVQPLQFADAFKTLRQNKDKANVQRLTEAYLAGDVNAIEELAAVDRKAAAEVMALQEGMAPKKPKALDTKLLSGQMEVLGNALKANPEFGDLIFENMIESYADNPRLQANFRELHQGFKVDPQGALDEMVNISNSLREPEKGKGKGDDYAPSDVEKNFTRVTALRQQLSSAEKSGDENAIQAANQQLNDFMSLTNKFGEGVQEKADIAVDKASRVELSKQAAAASKDAFDALKNVRSSIGNMTDAINSIDKGAETGPIISKLPSFRDSTIELDNIRGKMGLDIVGATTFGALSESELKFALDVALPTNLEPKALKEWLVRKKAAQQKLGKELMRAATFLGKPGNTISKYIESETKAGRLKFEEQEKDITSLSDDDLFK